MRTFYLESQLWKEPYALVGAEAHHLVRVVKVRVGEQIRLLDGAGREGVFTISSARKQQVLLELDSELRHPPRKQRTVLAVGYTKSVRRGWLLEKAVELEADAVWIWQAERSQAKVPLDVSESWQNQLLAGAKQSVNPYLPQIRTMPDGVCELAAALPECEHSFMLYEGATQGQLLTEHDLKHAASSVFILGPEGGFTDFELSTLTHAGAKPVSLGSRVLRWETAALLCLGLRWWACQGDK